VAKNLTINKMQVRLGLVERTKVTLKLFQSLTFPFDHGMARLCIPATSPSTASITAGIIPSTCLMVGFEDDPHKWVCDYHCRRFTSDLVLTAEAEKLRKQTSSWACFYVHHAQTCTINYCLGLIEVSPLLHRDTNISPRNSYIARRT
jgi:hypothetical protein